MRTAFVNQLIEEARTNERIFLIVGDLGFSVIEPFAIEFPERFLNAGVAEQNMMGIAAGMALEGYKVFVYSIGNFPTLRCMEQIRYDVCYHNLDVKIVAVGGGYSYGALGPSHHATEEIGMLKTIPNLSVIAPGDPIETKIITSIICDTNGPTYLRLGKAGEKIVHTLKPEIAWGNLVEVHVGKKKAILCSGSILSYANQFIANNKLEFGLFSVPFIKPLHKMNLIPLFEKYQTIITLEEHQKNTGLGSSVLMAANDLYQEGFIKSIPSIKIIGIEDLFYEKAGSQEYIRNENNLTLDCLLNQQ
jgi:transketolase